MARRRNQYAFPGQRPAQIDTVDQSRFWQRLDELSRQEKSADRKRTIDHLKASIRKVTEQAKWISTQVCRFMPQYTLHEERHFLNVLAIMDALVPNEVVPRLGPLDCALPILAAYTHDLGMALSQEEHDRLHDESTEQGKHFASYRTRFDEELRQLERWRKVVGVQPSGCNDSEEQAKAWTPAEIAAAKKRIDAIVGHILGSYLRETHTEDDQIRRLRRWLDVIKQETGDENVFRYGVGGKDYQRELALIGISHGRGAPWLRRQLIDGGPDDRFFQPVATGESANLAFPGLLLRLADVMDFDASRAPRILFKHFGIENEQSVLEWNKHLSVVGWRLDVDPGGKQQPDLLYSAECQHPVHEKAIREYKTWIDAELSAVRIELDAQRRQLPAAAWPGYDLHLPSQTRLDIRSARDPRTDQPKYVYHDLQFRLDQDEIQQLLMGESLYGDPGLCIRELLQNALDALELRELRLKMKQKGEAREPVDGELIRPGWVREPDGREEELRVTLDWGTDGETGQQWLRVTDNGVGMTEEVIKNYFTQIGKSYYRSPEFNQERAAMKAAGEVVSPISIFGIGILSCFMIADRIKVRTKPNGSNQTDRPAFDVMISGPGSLFWIEPGSMEQPGTEVTIHLKSRFKLAHNATSFLSELRLHFHYEEDHDTSIQQSVKVESPDETESLDPALIAAKQVVWPRYAIMVGAQCAPPIRIDNRFHLDFLAPISEQAILDKAAEWNCPHECIGTPQWITWDWSDTEDSMATGSRIRLWFPVNEAIQVENSFPSDPTPESLRCRQDELATFVETTLEDSAYRTRILVNGMNVHDTMNCFEAIEFCHGVGTRVWIDLRGSVSPQLTVNRQSAIAPQFDKAWQDSLDKLLERFRNRLKAEPHTQAPGAVKNLHFGLNWCHHNESPRLSGPCHRPTFDLAESASPSWRSDDLEFTLSWLYARMLQATRVEFDFANYLRRFDFAYIRDRDFEINAGRNYGRSLEGELSRELDRALQLDLVFSPYFRPKEVQLAVHEAMDSVSIFVEVSATYRLAVYSSFTQEAFGGRLDDSFPPLGLSSCSGGIDAFTLEGPALLATGNPRGNCNDDTTGSNGEALLVQRGYDLTFPMTAVPLGPLRRKCEKWRSDRRYRPLGVAPFLVLTLQDFWCRHASSLQETFKVPHIYSLLPRFELWSKRFSDWTEADWHDPENLSALWDLSGHLTGTPGQVLWARGTHDISEIPKRGLPAPDFLVANRT